jgi:hypothetical protein
MRRTFEAAVGCGMKRLMRHLGEFSHACREALIRRGMSKTQVRS